MREVVGFLLALFVVPSLVVAGVVYLLVDLGRGVSPVVMGLTYVGVAIGSLFAFIWWRQREV